MALAVLLIVSGGGEIAAAGSDSPPGEPASFYGETIESNGTAIPAGVEIVAVVNGTVEGNITVETAGRYGGASVFDDKLRVDSTAGEEVTFRLGGANGSIGGTAALESGITEANLTFPNGTVASLPPNPATDIEPNVATAGDSITFSANGSTAYAGTELVAFEWAVERDNETIETFDGEKRTRSFAESGKYDVVLTVTDADGRRAAETSDLEIQPDTTDGSAGSGGGGGGGTVSVGGGGSTAAGGGGGGGGGGTGSSGEGEESGPNSGVTDGSGTTERSRDPVLAETHGIEDRFPNAPGTAVLFEKTAIREIRLEGQAHGEISIEEFDEPTDNAPPLPDGWSAASASVITVPDEHRRTNATLRAVVSEGWVAERGFAPESLTVYRLPDDGKRWESLPTETFEIEGGYAVEAETPGFSQFVVAGREPPAVESDEPQPTDTGTESTADGSRRTGPDRGTGKNPSEPTEGQSTGFDPTTPLVPLAALGALLVVVAAIGRLFIPRRRDEW
jgi:PGF-pre-PGF domain-containing protein